MYYLALGIIGLTVLVIVLLVIYNEDFRDEFFIPIACIFAAVATVLAIGWSIVYLIDHPTPWHHSQPPPTAESTQ